MKNQESLFRSKVNGYAFIYTKNDWENGAKDREDHLVGKQGESFTNLSGKQVIPMICELVLANDLHAGHWSGTLQFKVSYTPGELDEKSLEELKNKEEALKNAATVADKSKELTVQSTDGGG